MRAYLFQVTVPSSRPRLSLLSALRRLRSREFYRSVFGATVVLERDPVILKLANS